MPSLKTASLGLLTATLIFLVADGPALTEAADKDLKAFTLYPGIGYLQGIWSSSYNWTMAFHYCVSVGGLLAVPNSEEEADIYKEIIAGNGTTYQEQVFIGFHDLFINGNYETVNDYSLVKSGYTRWALGAPNVSLTLRCGGFSEDGGMLNIDCTRTGNSLILCERPLWTDYDFVPEIGYFKFHTDAKTWQDAWQTCKDEDSHLAVINSMAEHQALHEIYNYHPNVPEADDELYAWVGVHAKFAPEKLRTVLGTSLYQAGFSTFESGDPSQGFDFKYTYVALKRGNGNLRLRSSTQRLAFFCEHEL